jgi:hypothetical protein
MTALFMPSSTVGVSLRTPTHAAVTTYVHDPAGKRTVTYTAGGYSGILTDLGYTGHIQVDAGLYRQK